MKIEKRMQDWTKISNGRSSRSNMTKDNVDVKEGNEYAQKHVVATITDDPAYRPASSAEFSAHDIKMDAISKKVDDIFEQVFTKETELLEPTFAELTVRPSPIHVVSLCASSVLASLLILMGLIAPLIEGLPNRLFWLSMGFPAAGVASANLIILLSDSEKVD